MKTECPYCSKSHTYSSQEERYYNDVHSSCRVIEARLRDERHIENNVEGLAAEVHLCECGTIIAVSVLSDAGETLYTPK